MTAELSPAVHDRRSNKAVIWTLDIDGTGSEWILTVLGVGVRWRKSTNDEASGFAVTVEPGEGEEPTVTTLTWLPTVAESRALPLGGNVDFEIARLVHGEGGESATYIVGSFAGRYGHTS